MNTPHLLKIDPEFSGAMYLGKGMPEELVNQNNNIQNSIQVFDSLPAIEKMKMFFVMGTILLDDAEICLESKKVHFRVNNLKQIRSFIDKLIKRDTVKVNHKSSNDMQKGITLVIQGIGKIYDSVEYTGHGSIADNILNMTTERKETNLLGQFMEDLQKILIAPKEDNLEDSQIPKISEKNMKDFLNQLKTLMDNQ